MMIMRLDSLADFSRSLPENYENLRNLFLSFSSFVRSSSVKDPNLYGIFGKYIGKQKTSLSGEGVNTQILLYT